MLESRNNCGMTLLLYDPLGSIPSCDSLTFFSGVSIGARRCQEYPLWHLQLKTAHGPGHIWLRGRPGSSLEYPPSLEACLRYMMSAVSLHTDHRSCSDSARWGGMIGTIFFFTCRNYVCSTACMPAAAARTDQSDHSICYNYRVM